MNLAQVLDDEPALLLTECGKEKANNDLLLDEEDVMPKLNKAVVTPVESNFWYLDNGASNHVMGSRTKFKEIDKKVTGQVRFGEGSKVEIKGKGSMVFKCKNEEEVVLSDVYYVPALCNNIISLGHLLETGNKVVLHEIFLWVYDGQMRLLMKVKKICK